MDTNDPHGSHVHKGATNKSTMHLKRRAKELNDDFAAVLYHNAACACIGHV